MVESTARAEQRLAAEQAAGERAYARALLGDECHAWDAEPADPCVFVVGATGRPCGSRHGAEAYHKVNRSGRALYTATLCADHALIERSRRDGTQLVRV